MLRELGRDRARPHARLVHQRDRGRRDPPVRDAGRGRGGPRRHHARAPDRVVRRRRAPSSFEEALEIFERLGDRRGAMSTIIAMGYLNWAPDIHMGAGAGRHIEEIRRLTSRMTALTTASDRASAEAQMLYGVHVFARAKVIPDLAVSRGEEAFREASEIGDPALSFLAAGGTAMAYLDLDEPEAAATWLDRAAAVASANPTPLRARRMETWRGIAAAAHGDADGMRAHLQRAADLAADDGRPASRCEVLAELAARSAALGVEGRDERAARARRAGGERGPRAGASPVGAPALAGAGRRGAGDDRAGPRRRGQGRGAREVGAAADHGGEAGRPAPLDPVADGTRAPRRRGAGGRGRARLRRVLRRDDRAADARRVDPRALVPRSAGPRRSPS